jgi:hypothetical protein
VKDPDLLHELAAASQRGEALRAALEAETPPRSDAVESAVLRAQLELERAAAANAVAAGLATSRARSPSPYEVALRAGGERAEEGRSELTEGTEQSERKEGDRVPERSPGGNGRARSS